MTVRDRFRRPLESLRISVTDRCNLRCSYCMPEEEYAWLPRADILRFEEISRLVDAFRSVGVRRLRLTGGEPLLRRDLAILIADLASKTGISDLAMTTNGLLLDEQARTLGEAGLGRLTISIDSLVPERYREITRRDELARALRGIDAARAAGFRGTKLNMVVMRGTNEDELVPMLEFARERELETRFVEYMDVGGATRWRRADVVGRNEILAALEERFGAVEAVERGIPDGSGDHRRAPAERFRLPDGTVFGIIASVTSPFCGACDRSRLTADGRWYHCLYARDGTDLREPLRSGVSTEDLAKGIAAAWSARADRGAEERLHEKSRRALADAPELRRDPHLEMHTRGG